jgi:N-acetylneuraminic acid mutarotase
VKKYVFITVAVFLVALENTQGQSGNFWTQKASLPATPREQAVGFCINGKGYLGTGVNSGAYMRDFWEYNPLADTWTQKQDFNSGISTVLIERRSAVGISIGNRGYTGMGVGGTISGDTIFTDWWEFDPVLNTWTQKASFPFNGRMFAVAFPVGGKGYFGTGCSAACFSDYSDLWEYDPQTNAWTAKNGMPTLYGRAYAVAFAIQNKGYIGTGFSYNPPPGGTVYNDFWEYDPVTNAWTQKANFPGGRELAAGFSFNALRRGYIGTGIDSTSNGHNDLQEYSAINNTWTSRANFPGGARTEITGFSIGSKGYFACGRDGSNHYNDLWEYTPDTVTAVQELESEAGISIYPNPTSGIFQLAVGKVQLTNAEVEIYNVRGEKIKDIPRAPFLEGGLTVDLSHQPAGVYFVRVTAGNKTIATEKLVIANH